MLHGRSPLHVPRSAAKRSGVFAPGWRAKAAIAGLLGALFAAAAPVRSELLKPRIVSINLCTDQLLLSLADRDQILGLSPYVRDAQRSWARDLADGLPVLSGTAEEVLYLRPDLVLAGRFTKRATREILKAHGMRVVELDSANSIAQVTDQIRQVGALVGHPDRANARIRDVEAAAERARAAALARPLTILPLQRRGWIAGRYTLMSSLLETVGLRNAGAGLGRQGGFLPLEQIVSLKADMLLVSRNDSAAEDQGSALLQHPALRERFPPERRLAMAEQMTVCGGPEIATTLDRLAESIERLR